MALRDVVDNCHETFNSLVWHVLSLFFQHVLKISEWFCPAAGYHLVYSTYNQEIYISGKFIVVLCGDCVMHCHD